MLAMGIIGGIFGIIASIIAMMVGGIGSAFAADGANQIVALGFVAMLFSILGIIGGAISRSKKKLAGTFLLVSGIGGFICISLFFTISGILFIVAGLMGLLSKKAKLAPGEYKVKPEGQAL
ncbi:hypothetical protein SAMN02799624_05444 [Paenibacillus sp. UNC496MF]|uniref:DUF4064 domain-containing protein n=1 Tax=Paenibacillus sp. UNC496MF TaxID=1502753 RepID=UPI0008EAD31D|nr:DUF4064 domain-containing protein [Paenibacillus sp. UNC496MF]SFJ67867.1 hypothetical protein SAMN02799624_05444 [Paenibacillus sp. UNC496MF]